MTASSSVHSADGEIIMTLTELADTYANPMHPQARTLENLLRAIEDGNARKAAAAAAQLAVLLDRGIERDAIELAWSAMAGICEHDDAE